MVICAYAVEESKEPELKKMGVKDSKLLSPAMREKLFGPLLKMGTASVVENSAEEITELMGKRVSLNEIEAIKVSAALRGLPEAKKIFVDSPDPVPSKFAKRISKYFSSSAEMVCENKADFNYPVVGAASIVAKVVRDRRIAELEKDFGEAIGTGYSHDERTIAFVKKHLPDKNHAIQKHLRHKWETVKRLKFTQVKLDDFL